MGNNVLSCDGKLNGVGVFYQVDRKCKNGENQRVTVPKIDDCVNVVVVLRKACTSIV